MSTESLAIVGLTLLALALPVMGSWFYQVFALKRELRPDAALLYVAAQIAGGIVGAIVAHAMFELPLFPFQNAYGRAQRAVAKRHAVALIPRRHFARVLGMKDGTLDGLHLTQKGHDEMARRVAALLRFEPAPAPK